MTMADDLIFLLRKAVGLAVSPMVWVLLALGLALVLSWRGRAVAARRVIAALLALLLIIAFVPLGAPVIAAREAHHPPEPPLSRIGGIILLGGGEDIDASARWGRPELNSAGDRVVAAATLARRFPDVPVLVTGGRAAPGQPGEAAISARILTGLGVPPDRLIVEDRARNTRENARLSLAHLTPDPARPWVLVTSAFHMSRAMAEFAVAGWPEPIPWPVDYRTGDLADTTGWDPYLNMARLETALREILGTLAARLAGAR